MSHYRNELKFDILLARTTRPAVEMLVRVEVFHTKIFIISGRVNESKSTFFLADEK